MATNIGIHNPSDVTPIHPFPKAGNCQDSQEAIIEERLRHLGHHIDSRNSDSRLVWLKTGPHVYNPDLDLSVKVEAIRWMLRIAKHMHSSAREVMFLRIQNSLQQIERTLEAAEWSTVT